MLSDKACVMLVRSSCKAKKKVHAGRQILQSSYRDFCLSMCYDGGIYAGQLTVRMSFRSSSGVQVALGSNL